MARQARLDAHPPAHRRPAGCLRPESVARWAAEQVRATYSLGMRRLIAALAATGSLVGMLIVAAPAQAATASVTCPGANTSIIDHATLNVDEVLTVTASSCNQFRVFAQAEGTVTYGGVTYGPGSTVAYSGGPVTYTPPQAHMAGSYEFEFGNTGVTPPGYYVFQVRVTASDTPGRPWFQSVGRPAGGACESGWGASWEHWPNGGTGGFTCNRIVNGVGGHVYPTVIGQQGSG